MKDPQLDVGQYFRAVSDEFQTRRQQRVQQLVDLGDKIDRLREDLCAELAAGFAELRDLLSELQQGGPGIEAARSKPPEES